jgi:putative transcriptional regulator
VCKYNVFSYIHPLLQKLQMNRIKKVLQEKGIKQTRLAEKLGKSFNIVNDYCNYRRQPRIEIFYEVADFLSVDVKDLLVSNKIENNKV